MERAARMWVSPLLSLAGAAAGCALILLYGPIAGEAVAKSVEAAQPAAVETVYAVVIFGALLTLATVGSRLTRTPLLQGPGSGRVVATGAATGVAIGAGGLAVAVALAALSGTIVAGAGGVASGSALFGGALVVLASAGIEEILFRGWLQRVLVAAWGPAAGIGVAAAAFAALHVAGGARSPLTLVNLMLGGLVFGLLAWRMGLAAAVGAHASWNLAEGIALGLDPNPGIGGFGALADFDLVGAAVWGGSDEGLNASLAATAALLAILVPLLLVRSARPAATLRASPG